MPKLGEQITGSLATLAEHGLTARSQGSVFVVYIQGLDLEPMGKPLGRFVSVDAAVDYFERAGWPQKPPAEVEATATAPEAAAPAKHVKAPRGKVALALLDHMLENGVRPYTAEELGKVAASVGGLPTSARAGITYGWVQDGLLRTAGRGVSRTYTPITLTGLRHRRARIASGKLERKSRPQTAAAAPAAGDAPAAGTAPDPLQGLFAALNKMRWVGRNKAGEPVFVCQDGRLVTAKVMLEDI